jgi:hypothetical protein
MACASSWAGEDLVPLADVPGADQTAEDERVLPDELLGRLATGEDGHRPVLLRVAEGADHQQVAAAVEGIESGPVCGEMGGALLATSSAES